MMAMIVRVRALAAGSSQTQFAARHRATVYAYWTLLVPWSLQPARNPCCAHVPRTCACAFTCNHGLRASGCVGLRAAVFVCWNVHTARVTTWTAAA